MRYAARKIFTLVISLWLVSLFTFLAFNVIPGDPALVILGTNASPEQLARLRSQLGLTLPLPIRYFDWLGGFLAGHPGNSLRYSVPVSSLIASRIPITLTLAAIALVLIVAVSVPLGVYCAKKRDSRIGRFLDGLIMLNISIPNFFLGVILTWVFGILLQVFIPGRLADFGTDPGGYFIGLFFPALAIALPNIAVVVKFLRGSIIGQMRLDYVRTAFSKGNSENAVLYRHVLKNALVPVITLLGMIVSEVFSGGIIIEQVFGIPGIGRLLISSITSRDFPLVETLVIYIAFIVIVANFLVDVFLQIIDPRIKVK